MAVKNCDTQIHATYRHSSPQSSQFSCLPTAIVKLLKTEENLKTENFDKRPYPCLKEVNIKSINPKSVFDKVSLLNPGLWQAAGDSILNKSLLFPR